MGFSGHPSGCNQSVVATGTFWLSWPMSNPQSEIGNRKLSDGLDRLKDFKRGTLNAGKTGIENVPRRQQDWTLDQVGNWRRFLARQDSATVLDQARANNKANEITSTTEAPGEAKWAQPAWSARGNMTTVPQPADPTSAYTCKYDAWNRLVEVKDVDTILVTYRYDGTGRRIRKLLGADPGSPDNTYDYFFNIGWQILEVRKDGLAPADLYEQYVWSLGYIDALVLRDRDTTGNGVLDERLYYCNDANMNVTSLVSTAGAVVERYVYDPYGKVTIYNSDWSATVTWANSKKNEVLYCGYRYDPETGFYQVRERVYHPTLGRWLQRDPIGYGDGMGLYEYVSGSPTGSRDASGLGWTDWLPLSNLFKTPPGANVEDYATCKPSKEECCLAKLNAAFKAEVISRCRARVDLKSGKYAAQWFALVTVKGGAYLAVGGAMIKGGMALAATAPATGGTTGVVGICVAVGGGALIASDIVDTAVGFWKMGKIKDARDAAKQKYCKCPPPA